MTDKATARITYTWVALCALTVVLWWLGSPDRIAKHGIASTPITICVMAIALVKSRLIIQQFMEVRVAPRWLRVFTDTWLLVFWAAILAVYLR